jgi:hypothetical protein
MLISKPTGVKIMAKFTQTELILIDKVNSGILDYDSIDHLRDKLYEYFQEDMPYGTRKCRDGDPDVWIADHLCDLLTREPGYTNPLFEALDK